MCRLLEGTSGFLWALIPVKMLQPLMDIGVVMSNHLQVAAEERVIAHIEPDDRCIQPYVRFSQMLTEDEWTFALSEDLLHFIEVLE